MKAGKSIGDVIRGSHAIDQPYCHIANSSNTIIKYKYLASVGNMIIDLERCNKVRDLGVIVDNKLFFFLII